MTPIAVKLFPANSSLWSWSISCCAAPQALPLSSPLAPVLICRQLTVFDSALVRPHSNRQTCDLSSVEHVVNAASSVASGG
ncbi:hypothetical protein K402DRAFT_21717 [Aulographum hederae CBS 113979]|uniref:Uncharacterized protein n=1 Tax=Aulographum hederae CBS 113979 TaxID=1176131 RepID=A0A6G1H6M3_9PEZI|nr:hypothetical protein K402DRAFT_21717 [Aulographum hederae CBS 113979]